ncbi:hypothetical protein Nepgr_014657 [Nepenthes gracilis]|uniref:Uncharacterized protein n=1 Tax=Nepenthes gracilis TaxID=150966 RepID=A0AAD3SLG4_NEPGR|nr:hypothetical protein Nepgr_014657 [Nepenthes gracilis]
MLLQLVQTSTFSSCPFQSAASHINGCNSQNLNNLLPKTLFPNLAIGSALTLKCVLHFRKSGKFSHISMVRASLLETPIIWAGRLCIFYALLKAGLAGSRSNPLVSDIMTDDGGDLGFSNWLENFQKNPEKEAADRRKLVSKWHPTTKGTLKRNYRVPSKSEGRRLLKAIASLLSEDDHFMDAASHKGCKIRRESAHGESVCCNNVRALFDELPTPHLIVEIMAFPAGPLTEKDYAKAGKLESVLRSSPCV